MELSQLLTPMSPWATWRVAEEGWGFFTLTGHQGMPVTTMASNTQHPSARRGWCQILTRMPSS